MQNTNINKLTEESLKRKERLRNLRAKAVKFKGTNSNDNQLPKPIFRSYKPQNENTIGEILPQEPSGNVEAVIETQLQLLKEPMVIEDIDITNLAPRKPDWDLKRNVTKKLETLERRTQKAITELIRERLNDVTNQTNQHQDLFQAVNIATAHIETVATAKPTTVVED